MRYCPSQRSDTNFFGDFSEALKHVNRPKNRYSNVLPLDRTRVLLKPAEHCPGSDYINANFVDGIHQHAYIATQGPLKETSDDFWRMMWEQQSNVIVMLTNIIESAKTKCYKYWPGKRKVKAFSSFTVTLLQKEREQGLVSRLLQIRPNGPGGEPLPDAPARNIYHFQYKEWPDHGLPSSAATFRHLFHLVDALHDGRGSILVHCSAGIGRTGTFCAVHTITLQLDQHMRERPQEIPYVNVFETILKLRANRVGMVQTKDQFEFCYKAVLEEYRARVKQLADNYPIETDIKQKL
jgi:protein tyrosine phosphatase